ncbi:MAG: hypothetical protein NUV67_05155 [archaeon]|nr:hypothetical protein [archaeon]
MNDEIKRQILHLLAGTICTAILLYLPKEQSLATLVLLFGGISFIAYAHSRIGAVPFISQIIWDVERGGEKRIAGEGALSFFLGVILASIVFFPFDKMVAVGAVIALTFGDGFSTLAGKLAGKHKTQGDKTLEGTIGGVVAAAIALAAFFEPATALVAAIFGMLAEYLPINDNYTIPLAAGIVLLILI